MYTYKLKVIIDSHGVSCNWPRSKDTWLCEKSHGLHGCHPAQLIKPAPLIMHTYNCHPLSTVFSYCISLHYIFLRKKWILKAFPLFIWQNTYFWICLFHLYSHWCKLQCFPVVDTPLYSCSTLIIILRNCRYKVWCAC